MRLGVTPVPIPNTMVKTQAADGTMLVTAWESRRMPDYGGIAQLGEHLPCKQGVRSSNLLTSIKTSMRSSFFENCILLTNYFQFHLKENQDEQPLLKSIDLTELFAEGESSSGHEVSGLVKRPRAQGGCLGTKSR